MKSPGWIMRRMLGVLASAVAFGVIWPAVANGYLLSFATTLLIWIALSESWIVLSGYTGYVSLGHAAFVGAGAYVLALTWGLVPFWVGLLFGGVAAGVLALAVGVPSLRVRGPYFVILTLGIAEFVKFVVINVEASLGKFGRLLLGAPDASLTFFVALGLAAAAMLMALGIRHMRFGTGLRAIRENEGAAEMTGVPVARLKSTAFVLSAVIPGIAGGLMVARTGYFEPLQMFSPQISLTIITICIAGGWDSPWGPLIGALFLNILSEFLWDSAPQLYMIILGVILVLFVLKLPGGIFGWLSDRAVRLRRRAASRERVHP